MFNILKTRLSLGKWTAPLPESGVNPVARGFRGFPALSREPCPEGCAHCENACPTNALSCAEGSRAIDLGRCLFCPECSLACPLARLTFTRDHRLASTGRDELKIHAEDGPPPVRPLEGELKKLFGRSLKLRQVSAGGCNGCEAELIVTGTLVFDLSRFGVQFVASPRHADGLVITGPVSANMLHALEKTYAALPPPRLVIACGACAISGGPFRGSPSAKDGVGDILPVDLWIPGCPPHPWTIVDGILRLMGRMEGPGG